MSKTAEDYHLVDIWIGRFASQTDLYAYFDESGFEEDDDRPMTAFAADQGQAFYDHDFVEAGFHPEAGSFEELVKEHSFSVSYVTEAGAAYASLAPGEVNAVVLAFAKVIDKPVSVERGRYTLTYLGRFGCDPSS